MVFETVKETCAVPHRPIFTALLLVALASTASAKNPTQREATKRSSTEIDAMLACRSVADSAARLACYDGNAVKLSSAVTKRELVVIDRVQAREASRSLFGFSIPNFGGLFGGGNEGVNEINSTISAIGYNAEGGLVLTLADGSAWSQTDSVSTFAPRRGDKVRVVRGTLGSFFVKTDRTATFRAKRVG